MKTTHVIGAAVLIGSALIAGATALVNDQGGGDQGVPAAIPAEPHKEQVSVVYARRFEVAEPYQHMWRMDRPPVQSGWLMVLSASPSLLRPRQVMEPILYVGSQTAERVNSGDSGKLVVVVPGDFLLEDARVFFGAPGLPERTGQMQIDAEVERARTAGVVPPSADHLATVVDADVLRVPSEYQLRQAAIDLVEKYSPQERDLISGARVPLVK